VRVSRFRRLDAQLSILLRRLWYLDSG